MKRFLLFVGATKEWADLNGEFDTLDEALGRTVGLKTWWHIADTERDGEEGHWMVASSYTTHQPETLDAKRAAVRDIFERHHGQFMYVHFVKRDGSERRMLCRTGVKKGVKGVGLAYDPDDYGLLPVYDADQKDFRMVVMDTVKEIRANRVRYTFR
jgi:hypothetical protein